MVKIGINGFGRIGRLAFRNALKRADVEVVAINDLLDIEYLAYMLRYDSVHGKFKGTIVIEGDQLIVNGKPVRVTSEKSPEQIAWDEVGAQYVIEATGLFTLMDQASKHIVGGAEKVIISAPSKDAPMFVMGVNHKQVKASDQIISNASCTTNCLAPILRILEDNFGVEEAIMTTVHAATASQNTVDAPLKNWRRGRSALNNIIPTTTGATKAVTKVIPELTGKISGMAFRVPTADVSVVDLNVRLTRATSYEELMKYFKEASENEYKDILGYTEDEVVSQDFVSEPLSSVIDAGAGLEVNENFFKIVSWYDNEFGYATKIIDMVAHVASLE